MNGDHCGQEAEHRGRGPDCEWHWLQATVMSHARSMPSGIAIIGRA